MVGDKVMRGNGENGDIGDVVAYGGDGSDGGMNGVLGDAHILQGEGGRGHLLRASENELFSSAANRNLLSRPCFVLFFSKFHSSSLYFPLSLLHRLSFLKIIHFLSLLSRPSF